VVISRSLKAVKAMRPLSEGFAKYLNRDGWPPTEHQTPIAWVRRLTAPSRTTALKVIMRCEHYVIQKPHAIMAFAKGVSRENGWNMPFIKHRLAQTILLRTVLTLKAAGEYQQLIKSTILNDWMTIRQVLLKEEQKHLLPLPKHRFIDYTSALRSPRGSTIKKSVWPGVPSRLVGATLNIHLRHDTVVGYLAQQKSVIYASILERTNQNASWLSPCH